MFPFRRFLIKVTECTEFSNQSLIKPFSFKEKPALHPNTSTSGGWRGGSSAAVCVCRRNEFQIRLYGTGTFAIYIWIWCEIICTSAKPFSACRVAVFPDHLKRFLSLCYSPATNIYLPFLANIKCLCQKWPYRTSSHLRWTAFSQISGSHDNRQHLFAVSTFYNLVCW